MLALVLGKVISTNFTLSAQCDRLWPVQAADKDVGYVSGIRQVLRPGIRITDVGAGRNTPFAPYVDAASRIVGIDVIADDLAINPALSERVTADIVQDGLPVEARDSDLICSHFVLEHFADVSAFAREAYASLRPGGTTIHLFSGRWSLFAVANRLLPESVARRLLFAVRPESREVGGFRTYYDSTDPKAAREAFSQAGFSDVQTRLSWQVSQYARWCFPLFLLARAWEETAFRLRAELFASYVLLVASKP